MIIQIDLDSAMQGGAVIGGIFSPVVAVIIAAYLAGRNARLAARAAEDTATRARELKDAVAAANVTANNLGQSATRVLEVIQVIGNGHVKKLSIALATALDLIERLEARFGRMVGEEPSKDKPS
ncbi:MAG: hypothetical protein ACREC9_12455 [Methylocella sp.]